MDQNQDNKTDRLAWFRAARYGMFIHWGPAAEWGFGEQGLLRENIPQREYEQRACRWNPRDFDAWAWAAAALEGGFRYAVLTTRHHDGYCLWGSQQTDYTSVAQAAGRDFVREYVEAFREAGLRVGLYYSLADFRVPAYWESSAGDSPAWQAFRQYAHDQVRELLTDYGPIDLLWFDGAWPHNAAAWRSESLLGMIRELQPGIVVNNRLDSASMYADAKGAMEYPGESTELGDFGTPEHHTTPDPKRPWESCQTSTSRLWGFTPGEHWRTARQLLDQLCDCASHGGNLLLNVGPDADGRLPEPFLERTQQIGAWLATNGEAVFGEGGGDVTEFIARGFQTVRGQTLYLIIRYGSDSAEVRLNGLATPVTAARLLGSDARLTVEQRGDTVVIRGLPDAPGVPLYPVIALDCDGAPRVTVAAGDRLWSGDPARYRDWAAARGQTVWVGR